MKARIENRFLKEVELIRRTAQDKKMFWLISPQNYGSLFCISLTESKHMGEDEFLFSFNENEREIKNRQIGFKEELAEKSDVLISCITSADGLLFEDERIFKPGITIIPVHMRGFQNCDTVFDRVFGDDTDHVKNFKYFGKFKDFNEIGEVLAGRDKGRKSQLQRILAYNYGLALHDVIFVSKIYELVSDRYDIRDIETNKPTDKFWI